MCNTVNIKKLKILSMMGNLTLFYPCKVQRFSAIFPQYIQLRELMFPFFWFKTNVPFLFTPAVFKFMHLSVKAEYI